MRQAIKRFSNILVIVYALCSAVPVHANPLINLLNLSIENPAYCSLVKSGDILSTEFFCVKVEKTCEPSLVGELAYVGVMTLAEKMGLDSNVSYVLGTAARMAGGSLASGTGNNSPPKLFYAALQGAAQGALNVGINYAGQSLGLSPLVTGFLAASLGTIADGLTSSLISQFKDQKLSLYQAMKDGVTKMAENYFTMGGVYYKTDANGDIVYDANGNPVYRAPTTWEMASYQSRLQSFVQQVDQVGLLDTLENYTASFLTSAAAQQFLNAIQSPYEYDKAKKEFEAKQKELLEKIKLAQQNSGSSTPDTDPFKDIGTVSG